MPGHEGSAPILGGGTGSSRERSLLPKAQSSIRASVDQVVARATENPGAPVLCFAHRSRSPCRLLVTKLCLSQCERQTGKVEPELVDDAVLVLNIEPVDAPGCISSAAAENLGGANELERIRVDERLQAAANEQKIGLTRSGGVVRVASFAGAPFDELRHEQIERGSEVVDHVTGRRSDLGPYNRYPRKLVNDVLRLRVTP